MKTRSKLLAATITGVVLAGGGTAIAIGASDDDARERPVTGAALDRASAAALQETGGGRVTDTEAGDEEGAYEVEVTKPDGSQVDVHLDEQFRVLSAQPDVED